MVNEALQLFIDGVHEKDPVKKAILKRRMFNVMHGYIGKNTDPNDHIAYNHQRKDLFHIFSAKNVGHLFGLREYNKFLSFKEYIDMPIDIIDDLLEGYGRGTEDRMIENKKAADREAAKARGQRGAEEAAIQKSRGAK